LVSPFSHSRNVHADAPGSWLIMLSTLNGAEAVLLVSTMPLQLPGSGPTLAVTAFGRAPTGPGLLFHPVLLLIPAVQVSVTAGDAEHDEV
jgi:hypothetical protein